jgi:hypothetical protein
MIRIRHAFLCAVVIVLMITAGCTQNTLAPPAVVTTAETTAAPPVPSTAAVPAGTTLPVTAGTQSPGTCTADTSSDAANCGGCGYACPANAICQDSQCYCMDGYTVENNECVLAPAITDTGCPAGMSPCPDGYCYDLASSAGNCGICGNLCPAGMACSASVCTNVVTDATTAPVATTTTSSTGPTTTVTFGPVTSRTQLGELSTPLKACILSGGTYCDGSCVNLSTSTSNCGECGKVCKSLAPTCCSGTCVDLQTNESNCGTCGHKCPIYTSCISGSCKSTVVITRVTPLQVVPSYKIVNPDFLAPVERQI